MYDLTGQRFGRLLVLERCGSDKQKNATWKCLCDCGNQTVKSGVYLRNGDTKSCGCLHKETVTALMSTHKKSKTRLYRVWSGMKTRCYNPNSSNYKYYGGKGIKMCDLWANDFDAFSEWAIKNGYDENAPVQNCTIDRIDPLKGYSPENCRWVNQKRQCNNQTSNKILVCDGVEHTMSEWADILGIKYTTLRARIRRGHTIENMISA